MNNKIFALAVVLATGLSAKSNFDGVHLGVQAGLQLSSTSVAATDSLGNAFSKSATNTTAPAVGILAGYMHEIMPNYYAGLDLAYSVSSASKRTSLNPGTFTMRVQAKSNYAASAVFGYAIGNVMPFVKIGFAKTKMTYVVDRTDVSAGFPPSRTKKSKDLSGFKFGIGTLISLSDCLVAGLEYGHQFGGKKVRVNPALDDGGHGALNTHRNFTFKPSAQTVMLRLTYRMGM